MPSGRKPRVIVIASATFSLSVLTGAVTASRDGRDQVDITRVNGDPEMRYDEAAPWWWPPTTTGTPASRIAFTFPVDRAEAFEPFDMIVQREFKVADDPKP